VIFDTLPIINDRMNDARDPTYTRFPCVSKPRRPARPDICWAIKGVSSPFISPVKTHVRKGMFTPKARESSDTTTASLPCVTMGRGRERWVGAKWCERRL